VLLDEKPQCVCDLPLALGAPLMGAHQPWTQEDVDRVNKRVERQLDELLPIRGPLPKSAPSKYRNRRTLVDFGNRGEIVNGHLRLVWTFDSQREAEFYRECKLREHAKEISCLRLQEPYALIAYEPGGTSRIVGEWIADAVFFDEIQKRVRVVDVKSKATRTAVYLLKKKIVEACHGITIEEV
jgi:hypothetical protein